MWKQILSIKVIGAIAAVVIVIGGAAFYIKMSPNSVVVKAAEKIHLVKRVNPLIGHEAAAHNFFVNDYPDDDKAFDIADCYYKGGFYPNQEMLDAMKRDCRKEAQRLVTYAKKKNKFTNATVDDWLDQTFLKKFYDIDEKLAKAREQA
jgi:hypothetical protein